MPLFAGFDLTTFGVISAKDNDLTGNEINFSSDEAGIYFIGVGTNPEVGEDRKTYFAQLTLERIYLALATGIQFNITATVCQTIMFCIKLFVLFIKNIIILGQWQSTFE